jgi:hypothetical protein
MGGYNPDHRQKLCKSNQSTPGDRHASRLQQPHRRICGLPPRPARHHHPDQHSHCQRVRNIQERPDHRPLSAQFRQQERPTCPIRPPPAPTPSMARRGMARARSIAAAARPPKSTTPSSQPSLPGTAPLRLTLRNSQAVAANVGSHVSTNPADETACSALAPTVPDAASETSRGVSGTSSSTQSSAVSSAHEAVA